MKIDRRSFLGLGLGAAAGITVSPATWKLMDDSSIWTQNWPWTPVPADGEVTYEETVCSLCPAHCGITIKKVDGRPIKIEGAKGHPVNDGGVCLHGIAGLQYLYDPARVTSPMIRVEGKLQPTSWEKALDTVSQKLGEIRKAGNAATIATLTADPSGTVSGLFRRLTTVLGSNNFYTMENMTSTWEKTIQTLAGVEADVAFDLANSDLILSFGTGFIEGWGAPVYNFKVNSDRKKKNVGLIQIESRLSNTAAAADQWVAPQPGTEADLALALCGMLISADHFDTSGVDTASEGFKSFSKMVREQYSPSAVAKTTGIKTADLHKMAERFAAAKHPVAIAGRGKGDSAGSMREFAAVYALNCLAGTLNKKGGLWLVKRGGKDVWPPVEMDAAATSGFSRGPVAGSIDDLMDRINKAEKSPVQALLVCDANPAYALKNSSAVAGAIDKIPFVVSFSSFMDDTTVLADVILPSHMFLEREEDLLMRAPIPMDITALSTPVAEPVLDTRHPGDTVLELAAAMGGSIAASFKWDSFNACMASVKADIWDDLSENRQVVTASPEKVKPAVKTDLSVLIGGAGRIEAPGDATQFPLVLVPFDLVRLAGQGLSSPFAVKTISDTVLKETDGFVEINPETARGLNLYHGDVATLKTPVGQAKVRINWFDGIMPGVIAMAEGLGHDGTYNRYTGGKGVNVNQLLDTVPDALSGMDAAWGIRAALS